MDQQENNTQVLEDWELPTDFLKTKLEYDDNTNIYNFSDNYIKFFNFQTTVPPDTEQEKQEQQQAILNQVKLGILRQEQVQTLSYPPELQVTSSPVVFTVLNGKPTTNKEDENKKLNSIINNILNKNPINKKVGRNDQCPCGSGKKYKICHGR